MAEVDAVAEMAETDDMVEVDAVAEMVKTDGSVMLVLELVIEKLKYFNF